MNLEKPAIGYNSTNLDRASDQRQDATWVSHQLARPSSRIVPVWRGRNLIDGLGVEGLRPRAVMFSDDGGTPLINAASEVVFLGLAANEALFAADLSPHVESRALRLVNLGEFVDLRRVGPVLDAHEASVLAYARGILYWHKQHRHCGRCGARTESLHGGHIRVCSEVSCQSETFPRTDPAVIMLVEHIDQRTGISKCLLGHHSKFPEGAYSTLAGFVEPGESLEDAVVREVFEEAGIVVRNVTYQASQPWPFPGSIMLGFRAQAGATKLTLDPNELQEARWFTADEIAEFGEWWDEDVSFKIPRKDSIARWLVDNWVREKRAANNS